VVGLGRSLQIDVVADGIDTETQCTLLRVAGCSAAQGQLFGSPEPAERVTFAAGGQRGYARASFS